MPQPDFDAFRNFGILPPRDKAIMRWVEAVTQRVVETLFGWKMVAMARSGVRINHYHRTRGPGQNHLRKIG